jgi:hypothetical protein
MSQDKKAYFQGGGGVNEPTPKKKKYKSDEAIVNQPRFKEPLYRNYDLYDTEGVDGPAKHGPGAGWNSMQDYKSVGDFLKDRRKKLKDKYKADDSWIQDDGSLSKKPKASKARMEILQALIKTASHEHVNSHCKKCGKTSICRCKGPKNTVEVESCSYCSDNNNIDFPIDDQIKSTPIQEDSSSVAGANLTGGQLDAYLPKADNEGKLPTNLEYGTDTENSGHKDKYKNIEDKLTQLLNMGEDGPPFGLDNGLQEQEGLEDLIDSPTGKTESGTDIYTNTWF